MISKRVGVIVAVGLTTLAAGCSSPKGVASPVPSAWKLPTGTLQITTGSGVVDLHVQIAETEAARERGLMGVRSLGSDDGMAFLFAQPTQVSFWMKDTLIPLSIVFWDRAGRVVGTAEMVPCHSNPCPLYSPGVPYAGAAEANMGFFSGHGVRPGDRLNLRRT